jgi:TolB-like protein/DNA-binding winged helix-turn-helix (wHTH) protein/Tfp pilus assembly protein PilF
MEPTVHKIPRITFDRFEVDLRSGELRKNGRRLRLQAQPFELLALLLEHPGEVVTREEICRKLWQADTFVDFDHSLGTAINKIREALGDSADHPRFVETLPRRGYRFIGKIEGSNGAVSTEGRPAVSEANAGVAIEPPHAGIDISVAAGSAPAVQERRRPRHLILALVVAACLTILLVALFFVRRASDSRAAARAASIQSIAVLPLENLSGNPAKEYFADGMTDELITELARTKGLRVISRTSVMQYKGAHRPLKDIARELGVDGILEGTVLDDGRRVRVTVQLIYAPSETHLWAQSYVRDLSDLLFLQQEVAESVAKEVNRAALPAKTPRRRIAPAAHDAYLRGRYNWFAANDETARKSFEKAIELQPDYAAAYSGLADYYMGRAVSGRQVPKEAMPKGEAAAQKALQLDDSIAEAHNSMAGAYLFYRWNWKAAEEESQKAIELNPNFAEAYHLYGYVLLVLNRTDEALEAQRKTQELDPFARPRALGSALLSVGRYQDADTELRQRMEAFPKFGPLHDELAQSYLEQGREKESMEEYAEHLRLDGCEDQAAEVRAAFAKSGNKGVQECRLAQLKKSARKCYVSPLEFASAYARLGQADETFRWLEKAYDDHVPWLIFIQHDGSLKRWHGDPRYQSLVKRIGLPAAY